MKIKKLWSKLVSFYTGEKELDIILFKILGSGGVMISLFGAAQSFFSGLPLSGVFVNLGAAVLSFILIWFVCKTKKYTIGYLITTVAVFFGLFSFLFFEMGGLEGSMPYFFVFALVFTVFMFRGVLLAVVETVEIIFYFSVCYFSYLHPEYVTPFETASSRFSDQMSGILVSGFAIGLLFLLYIREYRNQRKIAMESSSAKSEFLANMSHEIRTPINMLLGMNEMIVRESDDSQITEYAKNVDQAGRQLLFMVDQVLAYSRLDMDKERLNEQTFNLSKMVEGLAAFYGKEAEKKGLEFIMNKAVDIPPAVFGDMRKLSQIITNLLNNAIKYTKKGTVAFVVDCKRVSESKVDFTFEIADTGIGIVPEEQERIFGSFERADFLKNSSVEGTGLGLAISKRLAIILGGDIVLESEYGKGSVFRLEVPLSIPDAKDTSFADEEESCSFVAPDARVLVVDDNNMNLMVVKSLLKRTLIRVELVMSAEACYEAMEKSKYDVVLMDYMMPGIDGLEAMKHIRELEAENERKTKVIVLTADATPEKKDMFLSEGFDDYLLKPIDWRVLETCLQKHLPEEMVTKVSNEKIAAIPEEKLLYYSMLLSKYDISFDSGLKFMSGDVVQFSRVAGFFVKSADSSKKALLDAIDKKDYDEVTFILHSLKGNSRTVGAEDLFYGTRRLERRCREGDFEYVESSIPVLLIEWMRAKQGLGLFYDDFEEYKKELLEPEEKVEQSVFELLTEAKNAVLMGNQTPALNRVDEIIRILRDDVPLLRDSGKSNMKDHTKILEKLANVKNLIGGIEFDEAEEELDDIISEYSTEQ